MTPYVIYVSYVKVCTVNYGFFLKLFTQKQKIKREKRGTMPIRYILDLNGGSVEVTITVKEKS